jgi:phage N-6-adenine-methyltransferase
MSARRMPKQKPGQSEQSVETPRDLLDAVVRRFGPLAWDLAASRENRKAAFYFDKERNGLVQDWANLTGNLWCNCEFGDITPWARKAAEELARVQADHARRNRHDWRVLLLTPAAVSTEWFSDYVHGHALVMPLSPRVTFLGHEHAFPKDLSLSIYGEAPGFAPWRWKS